MAGITIQGVVIISTIRSRERTTVRTDTGMIDAGLSISGVTSGVTLAVARQYDRQLTELVWYQRNAGGLYIDSADHDIDDGLYELTNVSSRATPETSKTALFEVDLTLRRIGGGPVGGNTVQRVMASSSLQANSYSITSTPRIAYPAGAALLNPVAFTSRVTKDGTINLPQTTPGTYAFTGADYNKGECKVFDTTGSAVEADWLRVWSPDHVFASPHHLCIDNGMLRITGITGGNNGSHRYYAWTGAAYTELTVAAQGDFTRVAGTVVTDAYYRVLIDDLSPWRVKATFTGVWSGNWFTKTITLERGHPLARVELIAPSAVDLLFSFLTAGRWAFTKGAPLDGSSDMQRPGWDDQEETPTAPFNAPEDNWVACFTTKSSSTGTLAIGAWASSSYVVYPYDGGGFYITQSSATSHVVYLGGVKYDTSSAQLEAEAGTLTGASLVATVAGASGSGNDQVLLNAISDQVDMTTNLASIGGSTVLVLFRIASETTGIASTVDLIIRNTTAGSNLASVTRDNNNFAAANTWYWQAVVGTGWNGTDTLVARVTMTAYGGNDIYVDQCIAIAIAGSATLMQVDDVAGQALTETIAWPLALASAR